MNLVSAIQVCLEKIQREQTTTITRMVAVAEARELLRPVLGDEAVAVSEYWEYLSWYVVVAKAQLTAVRKALGCPLVKSSISVTNAEERHIRVLLSTSFAGVLVVYNDVLPEQPKRKNRCQLQLVQHEPTWQLVCDNKGPTP